MEDGGGPGDGWAWYDRSYIDDSAWPISLKECLKVLGGWGLGFRVWGVGFRVWGAGFRVYIGFGRLGSLGSFGMLGRGGEFRIRVFREFREFRESWEFRQESRIREAREVRDLGSLGSQRSLGGVGVEGPKIGAFQIKQELYGLLGFQERRMNNEAIGELNEERQGCIMLI